MILLSETFEVKKILDGECELSLRSFTDKVHSVRGMTMRVAVSIVCTVTSFPDTLP